MRSLKLISHFTINQLHYQVHSRFVKVLFLSVTLCLEGFKFESEKKNSYKKGMTSCCWAQILNS